MPMQRLPLNHKTIILDTETTGLGDDAEIVEIAIINNLGEPLLNTLIKPVKPIPEQASNIHGITNEMVADCLPWTAYIDDIKCIFAQYENLIIYNSGFDLRMIEQTGSLYELSELRCAKSFTVHCAMLWYAEFWGEIKRQTGDYQRQSLVNALMQQEIQWLGTAHRALEDCLMTRKLILTVNRKLIKDD